VRHDWTAARHMGHVTSAALHLEQVQKWRQGSMTTSLRSVQHTTHAADNSASCSMTCTTMRLAGVRNSNLLDIWEPRIVRPTPHTPKTLDTVASEPPAGERGVRSHASYATYSALCQAPARMPCTPNCVASVASRPPELRCLRVSFPMGGYGRQSDSPRFPGP